jgi:hypothetical protein
MNNRQPQKKKTSKPRSKKRGVVSGISNSGKSAEDIFGATTKYAKTTRRAEGDFVRSNVPIEVKKVTVSKKSRNGTINQVRASKGAVLVVYIANRKRWVVLDARSVLELVANLKNRGQHNENPFECCNLSIKNLERAGHKELTSAEMKREVARAVSRTKNDKTSASLSAKILSESKRLAANHRQVVRKSLGIDLSS